MLSAVSERIKNIFGPYETNNSRKRGLDRLDYELDLDISAENDIARQEPALKRSRYTHQNGDDDEYLSRFPSGTTDRSVRNLIASWMPSFGWNHVDYAQPIPTTTTRAQDLSTRYSRIGSDHSSIGPSGPRRMYLGDDRNLPGPSGLCRRPIGSLMDKEDDIEYLGFTPKNSGRLYNSEKHRDVICTTPLAGARTPSNLIDGSIDPSFKFSPTITSTAARSSGAFTLTKKVSSYAGKSAMEREFPKLSKMSGSIRKKSPPPRLFNDKYINKTKTIFNTFTSSLLRKTSANARESYRLEDKMKYKELLQQYTKSNLLPDSYSTSIYKPTSNNSSRRDYADVLVSGALSQTKFKSERQFKKREEVDPIEKILGRPSIRTGPPQKCSTPIVNGIANHSPNIVGLSSTEDGNHKNKENGSVDDDDLFITSEKIAPKKQLNKLEQQLRSHAVYNCDWILNLRKDNAARKAETTRQADATSEFTKKLEERTKQKASLEDHFSRRLSLLDLTFPSKVVEIIEDEDALVPLTDDMELKINRALSRGPPDETLADKFSIQVTRRDINTLVGLNWLNDEVVNFYMNLLMERGKNEKYPSVYTFNTFFYPKLRKTGYSSIKRWTKKVDLFSQDLLLVPIHLGMHWCLAVVDFRDKEIKYYDSMLGDNPVCLESLLIYLESEHQDKKKRPYDTDAWSLKNVKEIPQQMNGSDCGMFACKFAEYISRNASISFNQEHMPYFRRRMVYEIVTEKLL